MQILPANLPRAAATIAMAAMANPATRASRFRSICSRSPTCAHSSRGTGAGRSRRATRFNPARASTRVTVDRDSRNAALICQAVARVRRSVSTAASSDAASRRGCRRGREDPSTSPLAWRDRAIHFATVWKLIPNGPGCFRALRPPNPWAVLGIVTRQIWLQPLELAAPSGGRVLGAQPREHAFAQRQRPAAFKTSSGVSRSTGSSR